MGKYVGYTMLVLVIVFFLEFFKIVDIPYFELPDFTGSRDAMINASEERMQKRFGD